MTVTVFNATFAKATGETIAGSISWDKYTPRRLDAKLCPHISDCEVDYPIWTVRGANTRAGMEALVAKMQQKAKAMKLTCTEEAETKYAPKETSSRQN